MFYVVSWLSSFTKWLIWSGSSKMDLLMYLGPDRDNRQAGTKWTTLSHHVVLASPSGLTSELDILHSGSGCQETKEKLSWRPGPNIAQSQWRIQAFCPQLLTKLWSSFRQGILSHLRLIWGRICFWWQNLVLWACRTQNFSFLLAVGRGGPQFLKSFIIFTWKAKWTREIWYLTSASLFPKCP